MAIYSLNLGFISRSAGRSAVGFSAYISGSHQQDERTGVVYDYGCKNDVIMSRILAPEGAPEWGKNSSTLWNKAEQFEDEWGALRFKNLGPREQFLSSAQTAQTIMGAIPIEFTPLEAEACVEEFLQGRFVSRGLVVEYALHWDRGNPHFHGQITRRALVADDPRVQGPRTGFSERKDRDIVSKDELLVTRKQWEVVVNKHLELAGHEVRIDCRSHEDRGSLFLPTVHEGWYAQKLAEKHSLITGKGNHVGRGGKRGVLFKAFPRWMADDASIKNYKVSKEGGGYVVALHPSAKVWRDEPILLEHHMVHKEIKKKVGNIKIGDLYHKKPRLHHEAKLARRSERSTGQAPWYHTVA